MSTVKTGYSVITYQIYYSGVTDNQTGKGGREGVKGACLFYDYFYR